MPKPSAFVLRSSAASQIPRGQSIRSQPQNRSSKFDIWDKNRKSSTMEASTRDTCAGKSGTTVPFFSMLPRIPPLLWLNSFSRFPAPLRGSRMKGGRGRCPKRSRSRLWTGVHVSRSAAAIGKRAARMAGKRPPRRPMVAAQMIALTRSFGVTVKAKAIWLKVCQLMVAALNPSKAK